MRVCRLSRRESVTDFGFHGAQANVTICFQFPTFMPAMAKNSVHKDQWSFLSQSRFTGSSLNAYRLGRWSNVESYDNIVLWGSPTFIVFPVRHKRPWYVTRFLLSFISFTVVKRTIVIARLQKDCGKLAHNDSKENKSTKNDNCNWNKDGVVTEKLRNIKIVWSVVMPVQWVNFFGLKTPLNAVSTEHM